MRPALNPLQSIGPDQEIVITPSSSDSGVKPFIAESEALRRVLAIPEISRSTSMVRLLTYICSKYFEGKTEEIREYSIAVDALGRREDNFDPRIDPIVRVTARTLRKKLKEYYEGEGKDDPLRLVLPLGHYVPLFVTGSASEPGNQVGDEAEEAELVAAESGILHDTKHTAAKARHAIRQILRSHWFSVLWKPLSAGLIILGVFGGGYLLGRHSEKKPTEVANMIQWGEPVWSDEFDSTNQQVPDPSKWTFDTGGGGWGAQQVQTYCSPAGVGGKECNPRRPNAFLDGARHLVLRAEKSPDGTWTSARITTRGLKEFRYGRIEARIKMPVGKGLWPSFWMLGSNIDSVGWPQAGSAAFVQNVSLNSSSNGLGPNVVRATVHGPHYYGANGLWHDFHLPGGARVDDGTFHTYGAIWSPGMIQFYVDDISNVYFVADSSEIPEGGEWVFDHPFYLLMNLAVGGDWSGGPDSTTPTPAEMVVEYVRVYEIPRAPAPSIEWKTVRVRSGASIASNVILNADGYVGRVHLTCSTEPASAVCSLATPIINFTNTLSQQDTLTISTATFAGSGRNVAPPGRYKITIVATTMSGEHSQIVIPFEVTESD
jgi:beta-glucanase (GH16 family)